MPEATGTGTQETGQAPPEATPSGKTYTEAEFNAHTQRLREKHEREAAKVAKELADLREAQKTEAEKAMDRVRQETAQEWAGKLQAQTIEAELKVRLLERGLPANALHLVKATNEIGTTEEIDAAIDATLKANEWLKPGKSQPAHSGQGGAPTGGVIDNGVFGPPWTQEKIRRAREQRSTGAMSSKQWAEIAPSIEAALRKGNLD